MNLTGDLQQELINNEEPAKKRSKLVLPSPQISDLEMEAIAGTMEIGEAAVRAVDAGVDLLLCCHREDRQRRVLEALGSGLRDDRAEEASERVSRLLAAYAVSS